MHKLLKPGVTFIFWFTFNNIKPTSFAYKQIKQTVQTYEPKYEPMYEQHTYSLTVELQELQQQHQ